MPGAPQFLVPGSYTEGGQVASQSTGATHWGFIFWLVVIGVVIPAVILGGLQVGGFSFVFRHR